MLEERTLFAQGTGHEIAEREDCRSLKEQNKLLQKERTLFDKTEELDKKLQKERTLFADGTRQDIAKREDFAC